MANVKISELAVNRSPSASATLAGVDGGETVQIPITEFVTKDDNGNVKIREGSKLTFYNKDESDYCVLECEENGTLSLNGNTVATLDDIPSDSNFVTKDENGDVTVNALKVDDGITCVGVLDVREGYSARFWSNDNSKNASLCCDDNGKLTLDGKEVATVDDIPSGGSIGDTIRGIKDIEFENQSGDIMANEDGLEVMSQFELQLRGGSIELDTLGSLWMRGDQTGLSGINSIEFLAGPNDESSLYANDNGIQITSPKTNINNVYGLSTKANGEGQPGQVLTQGNDGVYWANPSGGGSGGSPMTSITYAELRALRDAGSLVPGMFYRITDYECTTAQENTRAMSHNFYIIVQALSCDTLSEIAKADINTSGNDEYFVDAGANVPAWEIKYCLDNDTTRFAWALDGQAITNLESGCSGGEPLVRQASFDGRCEEAIGEPTEYYYAWGTQSDVDDDDIHDFIYSKNETITNGEIVYNSSEGEEQTAEVIEGMGVIYYMKDEHGNECPYDFKNIQFKRVITLDNGYPEYDPQGGDHTQEAWVYTFCGRSYHIDNDEWSELKDGSLESPYMHQSDEHTYTFCNNTMKPYYMIYDEENDDTTKCGKQYLNNNVFFGYWEEIDSTDPENYPFYYAYACAFIEIGYECQNITFGYGCRHIAIGNKCNDNIFKPYCNSIKLGNHCRRNNIDGTCITLDDMCEDNVLWGDSLILLKHVSFIEHNDVVFNKIYKGYFEIV